MHEYWTRHPDIFLFVLGGVIITIQDVVNLVMTAYLKLLLCCSPLGVHWGPYKKRWAFRKMCVVQDCFLILHFLCHNTFISTVATPFLNSLNNFSPQCEFLQLKESGLTSSLSPCALKVAISDMAQLMTAFSQVYNADFKGYCQREPPDLDPNACVFQSVHQLLHHCSMVLLHESELWI